MYEFGETQQNTIAGWTLSQCIDMLETISLSMGGPIKPEAIGFYSKCIAAITAQIKKLS